MKRASGRHFNRVCELRIVFYQILMGKRHLGRLWFMVTGEHTEPKTLAIILKRLWWTCLGDVAEFLPRARMNWIATSNGVPKFGVGGANSQPTSDDRCADSIARPLEPVNRCCTA